MAIPGQRFELDLDSDDFSFKAPEHDEPSTVFSISDIQEHSTDSIPPPPTPSTSKTGFPAHRPRKNASVFTKKQQASQSGSTNRFQQTANPPSDAAAAHQANSPQENESDHQLKRQISEENNRRLASLSPQELAEARQELLSTLSPKLVERLWKRANIEEDDKADSTPSSPQQPGQESNPKNVASLEHKAHSLHSAPNEGGRTSPSIHFPRHPRAPSDYRPLSPSDPNFLSDLRTTYFPELAHQPDPTSLDWLQDPSPQDLEVSSYSPALSSYPASSLRFSFTGTLIPPKESLALPAHLGLHHHGDAPNSAGYTVPELTLLSRSALPNQRCIAYQTLGRILFRLGRGDFGATGTELTEALWDIIETERVLEIIMAEANKEKGTHVSAKAYATEALWLWRKGCGGSRGLKKPSEKRAT